jgi:DNA-binding transcriptional regulator YdaS (Cro superfamily)
MLNEIIKTSGETQTVWAGRFGVSKSYLSDILNGNRTPSLHVAVRIERATGGAVPASSWVPEAAPRPVVPTPTPEEDAA